MGWIQWIGQWTMHDEWRWKSHWKPCGMVVKTVDGLSRSLATKLSNYRPHLKDRESTVFTGVCLSTPRGVPQSQVISQVTGPRSFLGVPQSLVLSQVTGPRSFQVVPQSCAGVHPSTKYTPSQVRMGYPPPRQNRYPQPGLRHPHRVRSGLGSFLDRSGWGIPPPPGLGYPLGQNSRVST